ncbi:IclR family transcriptional regulator [Allopusillimonas soli]|uniref:IclR family transcriptional regulator n=1 Tax=Allopusillimonas soli TaxID=659016 RepID=A0A853F8B4_9BURK|nr:IclR family transcriptional regulator [Allopusillimonas soli]NYT36874.1 IclR family transcriptional regulator [Allopusillimonas soli]TEA75333.1 IclR family transcriptional regulator [Allopusillimonas soli]
MATLSRSALRPFDILDAFRTAKRPLSLSEISQLANIPLSTCHSVVRSLEQYGLLYFLSGRESYPTRWLWDAAREINANDPVATRCLPALTALRDQTNETVILGTRQDDRVLYLLVVESGQTIRYSSRVGDFKPLHSSSIGKVMLMSMPEKQREAWLAGHALEQATPHTLVDAERLRADLEASRQRGYTITRGENVVDVMAIAAPLVRGAMALGVAVAGPNQRVEQNAGRIADQLLACMEKITL